MDHAQCSTQATPLSKQHGALVSSVFGHLPLPAQGTGGGGISGYLVSLRPFSQASACCWPTSPSALESSISGSFRALLLLVLLPILPLLSLVPKMR